MTYRMLIRFKQVLFLLLFSIAAEADETINIPHVDQKAEDSYQFDYIYADFHRAFAIAPGGAWAWKSNEVTVEQAKQSALNACSSYTQQKCHLFSVDDQIVFDKQAWIKSWGPYKNRQQAKKAETGTLLGQRFYDVVFTTPEGVKKTISDLRGKVVFIHFWGCWCPSCRYEFGTLTDMYRILTSKHDDIAFVILQLREPISKAKQWARDNSFTTLPLSDSGAKSDEDKELRLKDGSKIKDRKLARVFPASYVLDKNGLVVFSHMGSVENWTEYLAFFEDVIQHSGK